MPQDLGVESPSIRFGERLAEDCTREFDLFRALLTAEDRARRNPSDLTPKQRELALRIFRRLAEAEAAAHGMPLEKSFAREEVAIPVKCNVHPWMKGYIAVLKNPYFAVSDKEGRFSLKDLPPGSYTITAWQEKLGTSVQKITVGAGENKTVDFTFKQ